jgi:CRP-like cAMP-binding protein
MAWLPDLELLRRVPLFALLTETQLRALAEGVVRRRVRRGEIIVEQRRRSNSLFILLTGKARVFIAGKGGREITLAMLRPGDHVGEMSLIDYSPHSATVRAETASELLVLGRAQFAGCLPKSNSLSYAVLRGLVLRLRHANRQITSLALIDVYGRVARALLDMADVVDGEIVIGQRVSRDMLSKTVGASREMTGRVLKYLEISGSVRTRQDGSLLLKGPLPIDGRDTAH